MDDVVITAVKGDPAALAFMREMGALLHFFDDLIDRDRDIDDAAIHGALYAAMVSLPRNAFYREHFDILNPLVVMAIANWRIATGIERRASSRDELITAFVIRSAYVDILTMSAAILGGMEWAVECGPRIRAWAHAEGFDGYLENLSAEKSARERKDGNVL